MADMPDLNLLKLQELARYIASRHVTVMADDDHSYPDRRYNVLIDGNRLRAAQWTYDQAWCILVGMRAM
jgi:hypothetical protein